MISSATASSDRQTRGKFCSSFEVIRQAERRFIALRESLESALVSHNGGPRNPYASLRLGEALCALLFEGKKSRRRGKPAATSSERLRGSSLRRCEIRFRPGAWRRARVPHRKKSHWWNPCPSD